MLTPFKWTVVVETGDGTRTRSITGELVKNTIEAEWLVFEKVVVPETAGLAQRRDMQLAFYGGASATLALYYRIAGEESDDAAVEILQGLYEEAEAYAKRYVETYRETK